MPRPQLPSPGFISPEIQSPVNYYPDEETKQIELRWTDTQVTRLGQTAETYLLHGHGEEMTVLPCEREFRDSLVGAAYPTSYYPNLSVQQSWIRGNPLQEAEYPELQVLIDGQERKIHHYNTRIRRYADVPELNHIEHRVPAGHKRSNISRFLAEGQGRLLELLFREDFPMLTLPTVKMDKDGFNWYVSHRQAA